MSPPGILSSWHNVHHIGTIKSYLASIRAPCYRYYPSPSHLNIPFRTFGRGKSCLWTLTLTTKISVPSEVPSARRTLPRQRGSFCWAEAERRYVGKTRRSTAAQPAHNKHVGIFSFTALHLTNMAEDRQLARKLIHANTPTPRPLLPRGHANVLLFTCWFHQ